MIGNYRTNCYLEEEIYFPPGNAQAYAGFNAGIHLLGSAANQLASMLMHEQHGFDLQHLLEEGLTDFVVSYLGINLGLFDPGGMQLMDEVLRRELLVLVGEAMEMSLGARTRFEWEGFAMAALGTVANRAVGKWGPSPQGSHYASRTTHLFQEGLHASVDTLVYTITYGHGRFDAEGMALRVAGTVLGHGLTYPLEKAAYLTKQLGYQQALAASTHSEVAEPTGTQKPDKAPHSRQSAFPGLEGEKGSPFGLPLPRAWQAEAWEAFDEAYPFPWDSAGNILPMETGFSLDVIKRVACQELNTLLHHDITQGLVEAYLGFNRVFSAWEALTQSPMEAKRRSEQAQYRNYQNKWAGHQAFGETYGLTRAGDLAYGFLFDGPEQMLHGLEDVATHYVENVVQYGRWQGPLKTLEEDVFATLDYLRQLDLPQSVSDFWYESPREKGSDLFGVGLFAAPGLRALKAEGVFEGIGSLLGKRGWFRGVEKGVGLTSRLNRTQIRNYLSNAHEIPREQLVKDLQSSGLKFKGQGRGGEFMEFTDKQERLRIKIHPPDPKTPYHHIHIYDRNGRPLSSELNVVTRRSEEAHIEIQPQNAPTNEWRPEW